MAELREFIGRLHPLVLHLPIGLLLGALLLELLVARGKLARSGYAVYLWFAALSACVTATSGWLLGHSGDYGGETVEWHERLGIGVAATALVAALVHDASGRSRVRITLQRVFLVVACVLMIPAGHLGSELTHGASWLAWPERERAAESTPPPPQAETEREGEPAPGTGEITPAGGDARPPIVADAPSLAEPAPAAEPAPGVPPGLTFAADVAPILAARCTNCHGESKRKGKLRLDSHAALLAGGDSGPALVPGDAVASLFLVRATLPLEHEDHMPPEGKPQPTAEELDVLARWVAAGAPAGPGETDPAGDAGDVRIDAQGDGGADAENEPANEPANETGAAHPASPPSVADADALAALDRALVHHETARGDGGGLAVDVAAVAGAFDDAAFERLLAPLGAEVVELSLARSAITDATLARLAAFPRLARLDLRATGVTTAGLAALAGHPALAELVLARTRLDDGAAVALAGLPRLARVVLWDAGVGPDALAELRARPGLTVEAGDTPAAAALETEGELVFTSDRPLPGAELVPAALRPVNATCPVSGSPVNPEYSVVHAGRVVGVCCRNCPGEFWDAPERFADALR
jgi:uncharacterized membrane protein